MTFIGNKHTKPKYKGITFCALSMLISLSGCTQPTTTSDNSSSITGCTYLTKTGEYYTMTIEGYYHGNAEEVSLGDNQDIEDELSSLEVEHSQKIEPVVSENRCETTSTASVHWDTSLYVDESSYQDVKEILENSKFEFIAKSSQNDYDEVIKTKLEFLE